MFTIIGGDGKEYGPVTADQVRSWIAAGRANLQTKARRDGEAEWKNLGDFAEFSATHAAVPPALGGSSGSALRPATSAYVPAGPVDAKAYADALIARTAKIDVFDCLGRSFALWKSNFLPLVGVTLLVVVAQLVANMIPLLGTIAGLLLNGVFYGGLYYYYLGKIRGEHREVGDAFAGFTRAFVPLMLASLIISVVTIGVMLIFAAPMFLALFSGGFDPSAATLPVISPLAGFGIFIGMLLMIYLSVSWIFSFALVIDKGLGPWTAMEVSRRVVGHQWFRVFFVVVLGSILAMLGLIGFFIGVLFTLPLLFGAVLYAYEDICNPPLLQNQIATPLSPA